MSSPKSSMAAPRVAEVLQADLTLEALRFELDGVDDEILTLVEHRLRLARLIGGLKEVHGPGLKLRPDREARVVGRLAARAAPGTRHLAQALWRELMSAGLAVQGQIEVVVWSGARRDVRESARIRFGASADYRTAHSPLEALDAADGERVAVLALDPDTPWWTELLEREDLWVFEAMGRRGPADPTALAVGRIMPATLARGVAYRISTGGDSGMDGRAEKVIGVSEGRRLCAIRDGGTLELDRAAGIVGAAANL